MQHTFGETVGLETMVPIRRHPDDIVHCIDGEALKHRDVHYDCRDFPWADSISRDEADVGIVTDILMGEDERVCEYCTDNDDYIDPYIHMIDEDKHNHADRVEEWIRNEHDDPSKYDDCMDKLVDAVLYGIDGSFHCCKTTYYGNEYAAYNGPGCCLFSFSIDEYENQIDFDRHPELQELHDRDALDDILDQVNCDVYVDRNRSRVFNKKSSQFEYVGRETYKCYGDCDHITGYHNPGGAWHIYVDADIMAGLLIEAIIGLCKKNN